MDNIYHTSVPRPEPKPPHGQISTRRGGQGATRHGRPPGPGGARSRRPTTGRAVRRGHVLPLATGTAKVGASAVTPKEAMGARVPARLLPVVGRHVPNAPGAGDLAADAGRPVLVRIRRDGALPRLVPAAVRRPTGLIRPVPLRTGRSGMGATHSPLRAPGP